VPHPVVAAVEGLGVCAVETPHAGDQVALRGLDEQVIGGAHQVIGVTDPPLLRDPPTQQVHETRAVLIVLIDPLPGVAARGDVIERPGVFDA
jgi:hypothetical protein